MLVYLIPIYILVPVLITYVFRKMGLNWVFIPYLITLAIVLYAPAMIIGIEDFIAGLRPVQPITEASNLHRPINCGNAQIPLYFAHFFLGLPLSIFIQYLLNRRYLKKFNNKQINKA